MKKYILILLILPLITLVFAQNNLSTIDFEVNKITPPIALSKQGLKEAKNLTDLNPRYPSNWVKAYKSVEITTIQDGKIMKARGQNDQLTQEQKSLMLDADVNTDISINIEYMPDNNLKTNELQSFSFSLSVLPEKDAVFIGGNQELQRYLKKNMMDDIDPAVFNGYDLAVITFSVDEAGRIVDVQTFDNAYYSFKDENIEKILIEALCNMPDWQPASYANGRRVKQDFVLTVGNHQNCILPLLNIGRTAER